VRLVLAKSFARIFFRNAINNGLAVVECPEIVDGLAADAPIEVDLAAGTARSGERHARFPALAPPLLAILSAGGLWAAAGRTPQEVA
jgi:3-isopropylmalate/(R)-2-methylmalate dehydratase small subunit